MNLNLIAKVLIICLGLLEAVSSTPVQITTSDGQEYFIEPEEKWNWQQAWDECARSGYQLVEIETSEKNTAIIQLLQTNNYTKRLWIGGTDEFSSSQDRKRDYVWSATGNNLTFTDWSIENPYHSARLQHCVYLMSQSCSHKWDDDVCTYKKGFICETNHFKKTYDEALRQKCAAFRNIFSTFYDEISANQEQMISNLDSINGTSSEILPQLSSTNADITQTLTNQNTRVSTFFTDTLNLLRTEFMTHEYAIGNITQTFNQTLTEQLSEINNIC